MSSPRIILHMTSSLDGRALVPRWHPSDAVADGLWQHVYDRLAVKHRILGRSTGEETAHLGTYPDTDDTFDRSDYVTGTGENGYRVVIDPSGKLVWTDANTKGAEIVVVLNESVPDRHLAGLRRDGVSYLFAGTDDVDVRVVAEKLATTLGISETLLSGGPATSGRFLRAGLIDELSLLLAPAIDGADESPTIFAGGQVTDDEHFPVTGVELTDVEKLEGGMLWLRYTLTNR